MTYKHKLTGVIAKLKNGYITVTILGKELTLPCGDWLPNNEWEKVKENNWEITAIRCIDGELKGMIVRRENLKCPPYYEIFEIRRLSDNCIFKVGDYVESKHTINKVKIIKFGWNETAGIMEVFCERDYEFNLDEINKTPKKLFTTEDGVDIYKGDSAWLVNTERFDGQWIAYHDHNVPATQKQVDELNEGYTKHIRYFSTKEAAEKYILENKPVLSYNDIVSTFVLKETYKAELLEMVKSKS